jgi:hypothetical protein
MQTFDAKSQPLFVCFQVRLKQDSKCDQIHMSDLDVEHASLSF